MARPAYVRLKAKEIYPPTIKTRIRIPILRGPKQLSTRSDQRAAKPTVRFSTVQITPYQETGVFRYIKTGCTNQAIVRVAAPMIPEYMILQQSCLFVTSEYLMIRTISFTGFCILLERLTSLSTNAAGMPVNAITACA